MGVFDETTEHFDAITGLYTLIQFDSKTGKKYVERINERTLYRCSEEWNVNNSHYYHILVIRPLNNFEKIVTRFWEVIRRLVPHDGARWLVYALGITIIMELFLYSLTQALGCMDITICVNFYCRDMSHYYLFIFGWQLIIALIFGLMWPIFKAECPEAYMKFVRFRTNYWII